MGIICEKLTLEVVAETVSREAQKRKVSWQLYSQVLKVGIVTSKANFLLLSRWANLANGRYLTSKEARRCDLSWVSGLSHKISGQYTRGWAEYHLALSARHPEV